MKEGLVVLVSSISIPKTLRPQIGKFGCGPAIIRNEALAKLANSKLLGTSHRQAPVKNLVAQIQTDLKDLFNAPEGYEVVLGNGGATTFWALATASLITERAVHSVFGSFGAKFAQTTLGAPFLSPSILKLGGVSARNYTPGSSFPQAHWRPDPLSDTGSQLAVLDQLYPEADAYCWPHHETSTGVISPVKRIEKAQDQLMIVDATSIAGAIPVDLAETDLYYFSVQKAFSSEGGLWVTFASPGAIRRAEEITANRKGRWIPEVLDFSLAQRNSAKHQTLNTPSISTLVLLADQLSWLKENGGLSGAHRHCCQMSNQLYAWADKRPEAAAYVTRVEERSPVVVTIDFKPEISTKRLLADLRANGIYDLNPYRGVAENQLRIGCFPSQPASEIEALLACLDYLLERY